LRYFERDRTSAWENQMGMIGTFDAKKQFWDRARGGNRRPYYSHLGIVITVTDIAKQIVYQISSLGVLSRLQIETV